MTGRPWRAQTAGIAPAADADAATEFRTELPASLSSARQARAAVREALASWGMDGLSADAELLASELVANAAEHGNGGRIKFALRPEPSPNGVPGVVCEVSDTSPDLPTAREADPDDERGRGLAIVTALARTSGLSIGAAGKTSWFTLASRQPDAQAEVGS